MTMEKKIGEKWKVKVGRTPLAVLERNARSDRSPTVKQCLFLATRCEKVGITATELVKLGIELGRLHPKTVIVESHMLSVLTFPEIGGLFAIVKAWGEEEGEDQ